MHIFLKGIMIIIQYTFFPNINYQKTCYAIHQVKGYRKPPPYVGKVMEKDHFRDECEDIKMELRPRLK
jgi:hypothetical protein